MKKSLYVFITLFLFFAIITFSNVSSAATLDTIDVDLSKEKVAPGQEVSVIVNFGREMGAYTITTDYDKDIFEYISSEGGTANDTEDGLILTYFYTQGQGTPRKTAKVTFKAKEELTATNTTQFLVQLTGMADPDANDYDDPADSYIKDVVVEPNYVDYTLALDYEGTITKDVEKDMKLTTSSTMGKNYDHVRLLAEVTSKPDDNATAKLLATEADGNEIDLLVSGWGEADGYALGGKNVKQELALRGLFSTDGKYTIHIKLIDKDNSDSVIAEKSFDITIGEKKVTETTNEEKLPTTYPTTGITQYVFIAVAVIALVAIYVVINKKTRH